MEPNAYDWYELDGIKLWPNTQYFLHSLNAYFHKHLCCGFIEKNMDGNTYGLRKQQYTGKKGRDRFPAHFFLAYQNILRFFQIIQGYDYCYYM